MSVRFYWDSPRTLWTILVYGAETCYLPPSFKLEHLCDWTKQSTFSPSSDMDVLSFIQEYNNTSLFDQTGALKGQRQYNKWFDDIYSNKDEQFNDKDQSKPSFCFKIVF
jgi:hypothetical protein